jgi:hypothetical protein
MEVRKLSEINLDTISFIREKTKNKKKTHYLINKTQRISFTIGNVNIPFGFEEFNKKRILNIEITKEKHNDIGNLLLLLEDNIEKINTKKIVNTDLLEDIANKTYYKSIKNSKYGKIIRTYILHDPEIYAIIKGNKMPMASIDLKKTICNVNIEINGIWINDTNYGLLLYVHEIQILNSY